MTRLLLEAGADPNTIDAPGLGSALDQAINRHLTEHVRLLVQHGAYVNLLDMESMTPERIETRVNFLKRNQEIWEILQQGNIYPDAHLNTNDKEESV